MEKILIVELVENCKLVNEGSRENGHDCWGNLEFTSYKYVWINRQQQECWDGWYVIHDGENVQSIKPDSLKPNVEYQENAIDFAYGWTPSTEKDYNNPKAGFEYRMIVKQQQPAKDQPEKEGEKHFLLGRKIRYRYVDWEEGSFTPWSPCTEKDLKTILEDGSVDIVQFKP